MGTPGVRGNLAVADAHHSVRGGGDVGFVRDQHDGSARGVQLGQQAEYVGARGRVEVSGRLVGEDQRRVRDQRPSDRHPLLLTAGELAGSVFHPIVQTHPGQGRHRPLPALRPSQPGVAQRQLDVAPG